MIPLHDDNPTEIFPVLTVAFIAACVLVFLWQASLGTQGYQASVYALGVIPAVLLNKVTLPAELAVVPATVTVFTSMFLHGGFMHLAGNMLYLWIFGNNVEDAMGHGKFIVFYLVCGVAAVFGQVLQNPSSEIPMIGASGAISGVLGAYLILYPRARVLVLIPSGVLYPTGKAAGLMGTGPMVCHAVDQLRAYFVGRRRRGLVCPHRRFCRRHGADPVLQDRERHAVP